jgi:hypothetical protein
MNFVVFFMIVEKMETEAMPLRGTSNRHLNRTVTHPV